MNICILHCLIDLYMEIRFTVNVPMLNVDPLFDVGRHYMCYV